MSTWTQGEMATKWHDRVTAQWRQEGDKMTASKAFKEGHIMQNPISYTVCEKFWYQKTRMHTESREKWEKKMTFYEEKSYVQHHAVDVRT